MNICKKIIIALILSGNIFVGCCYASSFRQASLVSSQDRVLILAPHPDDETIGTAGIIQKTVKAGAKVKVVLFTNGDNNELAFIVYKKRIVFKKNDFLKLGEIRKAESFAAMESLGLSKKEVVVLGYPDFGTMEILTKYWGRVKPYRSMFPRQVEVPYSEAVSPGSPYVGDSILRDLSDVIYDFKPTKIFVSHPADTNRDHKALYVFLRIVLWDLKGKIFSPEVFPYLIHVAGWPSPRGDHRELALSPPSKMSQDAVSWMKEDLVPAEIKKKYDAVKFYKSQIAYNPAYLFTFVRQNEIFGDYPDIKLKNFSDGQIDWKYIGALEGKDALAQQNGKSYCAYALEKKLVLVKIGFDNVIDEDFGGTVYILGYNKKVPFSKMPKIRISFRREGIIVRDKRQKISSDSIEYVVQDKEVLFIIPASILGEPDYMLSSVKVNLKNGSSGFSAWRVFDLTAD